MGCYASPSDPNTQQNRTQDERGATYKNLVFLPHLNPRLLQDRSDSSWHLEVVSLGGLGWGKGEVTILLGLGRGKGHAEADNGGTHQYHNQVQVMALSTQLSKHYHSYSSRFKQILISHSPHHHHLHACLYMLPSCGTVHNSPERAAQKLPAVLRHTWCIL